MFHRFTVSTYVVAGACYVVRYIVRCCCCYASSAVPCSLLLLHPFRFLAVGRSFALLHYFQHALYYYSLCACCLVFFLSPAKMCGRRGRELERNHKKSTPVLFLLFENIPAATNCVTARAHHHHAHAHTHTTVVVCGLLLLWYGRRRKASYVYFLIFLNNAYHVIKSAALSIVSMS